MGVDFDLEGLGLEKRGLDEDEEVCGAVLLVEREEREDAEETSAAGSGTDEGRKDNDDRARACLGGGDICWEEGGGEDPSEIIVDLLLEGLEAREEVKEMRCWVV